MNYILYGTSACHLCEEVEALIKPIQQIFGFNFYIVDIADDDVLLSLYGTSIPIFHCTETKQEITWPFNEHQVIALVTSNNRQ